ERERSPHAAGGRRSAGDGGRSRLLRPGAPSHADRSARRAPRRVNRGAYAALKRCATFPRVKEAPHFLGSAPALLTPEPRFTMADSRDDDDLTVVPIPGEESDAERQR